MPNTERKQDIRRNIRYLKQQTTAAERAALSEQLQRALENHPRFIAAQTVLLYSALPDEPETASLLKKWSPTKTILLPVVVGNTLVLRKYVPEGAMQTGAFGISEPQGENFTDYADIDLAVVPGVAFDEENNRLGRGKGFYDRLLASPTLKAYKVGYAFPFQRVKQLPAEPHDCKMDEVIRL